MPEEIKQEVILKTQKYLGKYVKKPPLTDKLLKKPPFRFLHDVINAVIHETGFLKGLYTDEELNSDNVKERDAKVAFLNKLIEAVKAITHADLAVRPSKIVAGLEPTETNILLQTIGKAIEKKLDSTEYVTQLHSGQITKKSKKPSEKNDKNKKTKTNVNETKAVTKKATETPKSTDREKTKTKRTINKESKSKASSDDGKLKSKQKEKKIKKKPEIVQSPEKENTPSLPTINNLEPVVEIIEKNELKSENISADINRSQPDDNVNKPEVIQPSVITEPQNDNEGRKSASRPKSARPRSGDLKEKPSQNSHQTETIQLQSRPKSSLRPPSVRPSSARPGAPRLRPDSALPIKEVVPMGKINVIIENCDKDDEEETVIIESNPEGVEEQNDNITDVPDNKGHLVEQILEQINESEVGKISQANDNDWHKDSFYGKDAAAKETNNLRGLIQSLTKTANPLGKLLNFVHEDIDAMQAELEMWTQTKRQLSQEIIKQKKVSNEMNKPLILQLENLNKEIKKLEEELMNTRSNILRNDIKIKELISK